MDVHGLICDYDGTIAAHSHVSQKLVHALTVFKNPRHRLILATGRTISDLHSVFEPLNLFDLIVAENGGVLFDSRTGEERSLAGGPPAPLISALLDSGVHFQQGRVVIAVDHQYERAVLRVLARVGLEYRLTFNKGAMMLLPGEVGKPWGLEHALEQLGLSFHNVVGVGDAENDLSFLRRCGYSAAVGDAHPILREEVDLLLDKPNGQGVLDLLQRIESGTLDLIERKNARVPIGTRRDGRRARIGCDHCCLLAIGTSGSGKSTFAVSLIERLLAARYQVCVFDPEGDYELLEGLVTFGGANQRPSRMNVLHALASLQTSIVVNLVAVPGEERGPFALELLGEIDELRKLHGRPHWIIIDEAHQLLPGPLQTPLPCGNHVLVTLYPDQISMDLLRQVSLVAAIGRGAEGVLERAAAMFNADLSVPDEAIEYGEALIWERKGSGSVYPIELPQPHAEIKRHTTRYARGEISPDHSFYFTGADHRMKLRAQNLSIFLQIADGVPDDVWEYHLRRRDYASWFRFVIKDEELARAAEQLAKLPISPGQSREQMRRVIEEAYTMPAISLLTAQVPRRG